MIELESPYGLKDETEMTQGALLLSLSSLFYGTAHYDRQAILDLLTEVHENSAPLPHLAIGLDKSAIRFRVDEENYPLIAPLLDEMKTATQRSPEQIELARQELLESYPNLTQLETLTPTLLARYTGGLSLTVTKEETVLAETFSEKPRVIDDNTVVIDGKIFLFAPGLLGTKYFFDTVWLGTGIAGFTTLGLSVLAPPLLPFAALFLTVSAECSLLKYLVDVEMWGATDPDYIKEKRQEDLREGFRFASKRGSMKYTLTPFERRNMFLAEATKSFTVTSLNDYPIHWLVDEIDLGHLNIRLMFYPEEHETLSALRQEFLEKRNLYYETEIQVREKANAGLLLYQKMRDAKLDFARTTYEKNSYIIQLSEIITKWNEELAALYNDIHFIGNEEGRKQAIETVHAHYEKACKDTELLKGYDEAKEALKQSQEAILTEYKEEQAKWQTTIGYAEQKNLLRYALQEIYEEYNNRLEHYLLTLSRDDINFRDFIDWRIDYSEGGYGY